MSTQTLDTEVMKNLLAQHEAVTGKAPKVKGSPPVITIREGYKAFSDVFGFSPPSGVDHEVRQFVDEDWPENMRIHIPPVDDGYVFPPDATEMAAHAFQCGEKLLAYGPKGSGKSSLLKEICARLRIPFIRINGRADMESSAIFGTIDPSTMTWKPGPAEELARYGGVLCVDEISLLPAGINMSMQYMLEENGKVYLADKPGSSDEKTVTPHEWFRVVATDNTQLQGDTSGRYVGAQVQNEAMLDRFGTTIELTYLSSKHETDLLKSRCTGLDHQVAADMVRFASIVRDMYDKGNVQFTLSPRSLILWGRKVAYWKNTQRAFFYTFYNKLIDSDRKQVAEAYHKVFGKDVINFAY